MLDVTVKRHADRPQAGLLLHHSLGNRDRLLWMTPSRQFTATSRQPLVELCKVGKARRRGKQPFTDIADLILDLSLLPA